MAFDLLHEWEEVEPDTWRCKSTVNGWHLVVRYLPSKGQWEAKIFVDHNIESLSVGLFSVREQAQHEAELKASWFNPP